MIIGYIKFWDWHDLLTILEHCACHTAIIIDCYHTKLLKTIITYLRIDTLVVESSVSASADQAEDPQYRIETEVVDSPPQFADTPRQNAGSDSDDEDEAFPNPVPIGRLLFSYNNHM